MRDWTGSIKKGNFPWEALIWLAGLASLALFEPTADFESNGASHWTLCIFKNLGISFCPGCGLGHAVAYLFQGEWAQSFDAHPLGIPVVVVLIWRSVSLMAGYVGQQQRV